MINILAAENDRQTASLIYSALSDKEKYHLAIVESGYTALEAIGQKRFDIIIIERDLSYMNGVVTARKIRERLGSEMSPFVITAPEFSREEVEDFIPYGIFDFWERPVSIQRIRLAVNAVAEGWKGQRDNLLNYREFLERNGKKA
ncbi:MAG: response regulator [Ruminococcaceae bacterium]|nr:response regulator [Oscillospiraceae bacterium]